MTTLVLGASSTTLGSTQGQPAVGYMQGSTLGAPLFAGATSGGTSRLPDFNMTSSEHGKPIPIIYGTYRVTGNVIWADKLTLKSYSKEAGAEYTCSSAVGICEGPKEIIKVWADGKVVFDSTGQSPTVGINVSSYAFYAGTETQMPDPTIEAIEKVGFVPAHRGLCYVVFTTMNLKAWGNRIPNFTFEVKGEVLQAFPPVPIYGVTPTGFDHGQVAYTPGSSNQVWIANPLLWIEIRDATTGAYIGSINIVDAVRQLIAGFDNSGEYLSTQAGDWTVDSHGQVWIPIAAGVYPGAGVPAMIVIDMASRTAKAVIGDSTTASNLGVRYSPYQDQMLYFLNNTGTYGTFQLINATTFAVSGTVASPIPVVRYEYASFDNEIWVTTSDNSIHVFNYSGTQTAVTAPRSGPATLKYIPEKNIMVARDGNSLDFFSGVSHSLLGTYTPTNGQTFSDDKVFFLPTTNEVLVMLNGTAVAVSLNDYATTRIIYDGSTGNQLPLQGVSVSPGGETLFFLSAPNGDNGLSQSPFYPGQNFNGSVIISIGGNTPAGAETLTTGGVVTDVSRRMGLIADEVDVGALNQPILGYAIASQGTGATAIGPLMTAFFFDAVESDGRVKFVNRGQSPVVTVSSNELVENQ